MFTDQSKSVDFHGIINFGLFLRGVFLAKRNDIKNISCIVLVGGRSLRLGRDKTVEPFGTGFLLERVLSRLGLFKREIIIVGYSGQDFSWLADFKKFRVTYDIYPGKGPLGGIYAGLTASTTPCNLVVDGDMPFLNIDFLRYMIERASGYDIVIPHFNDYYEPLHAVYARDSVNTIRNMLEKDDLSVRKLLETLTVKYVESVEIDMFDPKHLSFFNINTEADLKKAKELIRENP